MLFNSSVFLLFMLVVFPCYWLLFSHSTWSRNLFLIAVSYVFYGWWDTRFLALIVLSSAVDFSVGIALARTYSPTKRLALLACSVTFNLGVLGFFKYWQFFMESLYSVLAPWNIHPDWPTLNVILPLGISFYTLQTLSYTIDVYHRRIEATRDPLAFFAFVAFFPQLVAGPIERAAHMIPQFRIVRPFSDKVARDGMRQLLWGLFKKVVIADQCAGYADPIFATWPDQTAATIALAGVYFSLQIYCDFSGYSDMAIGLAKLFGFELMTNFDRPYFSQSVTEFWQRWHISLSTWLRDYLYIPLGGSRGSILRTWLNLLIVFSVSGLWHGAAWNFVLWGWLNFVYVAPAAWLRSRQLKSTPLPGKWIHDQSILNSTGLRLVVRASRTLIVFILVTFAWVLFRIPGDTDAVSCVLALFDLSLFSKPDCPRIGLLWAIPLFAAEFLQAGRDHPLQHPALPLPIRWTIYVVITILCIGSFRSDSPFIYFQF